MSNAPSQKTILFVEDLFSSIADVYDTILQDHPEWMPALRLRVPEAWEYLCQTAVSAVVLDAMLPQVQGVLAHREGIYLAAWIRGLETSSRKKAGLADDILPSNRESTLCFVTARTFDKVKEEGEKLNLSVEQIPTPGSSQITRARPLVWFWEKDRFTTAEFMKWLKTQVA